MASNTVTVEDAEKLIKELLDSKIAKGALVDGFERLAYPDGGHRSEEQKLALKLYGNVPATEQEVRIAVSRLIRKGIPLSEMRALLNK